MAPAGPVFRIARAPAPWAWPDWSQASRDGTFGNRWDDPEGAYRVLYASSTRFGALIETLARFRPDLAVIAGLSEIEGPDDPIAAGTVPRAWFGNRLTGVAELIGAYADIGEAASLSLVRSRLAARAIHHGLTDIDAAAIRLTAPRGFTQDVSRLIYECRTAGAEPFAGIRYLSRLDDGTSNWAVFEPASDSPEPLHLLDAEPVRPERAPASARGHPASMAKRLDVALLPSEAAAMEADAFLVIDVLRATTTIATLFARGLADLLVFDSIEAARARSRAEGRILFGEVGGLPPEGFDYGNSPAEAATLELAGQGAALFTTNGTRALCASAGRGEVVAASFVNASAAVRWAVGYERVVLVCAGNSGGRRFALEDFAAAARLVQLIAQESPGLELGDAARLAAGATGNEDSIAPALSRRPDRSTRLVAGAYDARGLRALGLDADITFAAREDTSRAVPRVVKHGEGWVLLRDAG